MNKKGFVLLETIAVLSIICVTLITLYSGYIRIIKNVKIRNYYDNTEYIYKAKLVGEYISKVVTASEIENVDVYIYCNTQVYSTEANPNPVLTRCNSSNLSYSFMLNEMDVQGVYITKWNTREIDSMSLIALEPTTQRYIKYINEKKGAGHRIIVMFKDRIDSKKYQYASLRFVPEP